MADFSCYSSAFPSASETLVASNKLTETIINNSSLLYPSDSDRWFACIRHGVRSFLELSEKPS